MMANLFPIEGLIDVASTTQRQRQLQQHEDHTCRRSNKGFVGHPVSLIQQTPGQLIGDGQNQKETGPPKAELLPGGLSQIKLVAEELPASLPAPETGQETGLPQTPH